MSAIVESNTFAEAWFSLLKQIESTGFIVRPRGTCTRELIAVQLTVTDMLNNILVHPVRGLNYRFMVAEWMWIMAGRSDVESIARYNKKIAEFSDDGKRFFGAYGPRLAPQWEPTIELLKQDHSCRQAVMTVYASGDSAQKSKDTPCTLSLQLLVRRGQLHGIVTMRSSDIWLGMPYDFFNFSMICNYIGMRLGFPVGSLTFNLGSSHLYSQNAFEATEVLRFPDKLNSIKSPQFTERPLSPSTEQRASAAPVEFNDLMNLVENDKVIDMNLRVRAQYIHYIYVLQSEFKAEAERILRNATS